MASYQNAFICAGLAAAFWTCIGLSLSVRLMPRSLAWPVAPALGWAVHSAVVFPIFCIVGMARVTVVAVTAIALLSALLSLLRGARPVSDETDNGRIPLWAVAGAAMLATAVMAQLLPQITGSGVTFTDVIFDHSKVAMIDEMARLGVPARNPFYGESDGMDRLSYYYLWHFSAAELVVLTGLSGWEADAGMTWFTAFSSLTLMMGLAVFASKRPVAAGWVLILATAFSIRPLLSMLFGREITYAVTGWPGGLGGWLFQITWAPQHVASAGCVLIAVYLLVDLSRRPTMPTAIVLSLIVAAGFESSTWVGGVTFVISALALGSALLWKAEPAVRLRFILSAVGAAVVATAIASPFIYDQFRASTVRADVFPMGFTHLDVLGEETPQSLRRWLDIPAYWTVFLFTEFAAFYPTGIIMMVLLMRDRLLAQAQKAYLASFGILALVSLCVGGLLTSQLAGNNNDLGWRSVLPAILVLIISCAAGLSRYLRSMRPAYAFAAVALIGLGCFGGIESLLYGITRQSREPSPAFVNSVGMWEAVRKHSGADERIANNPLFLAEVTRWPINLSWALLSNRRSCYAGPAFGPFAPRTRRPRNEIDAQFERVFSGRPEPDDLDQLANQYNCSVAVVTSQDGAWSSDPFAASPLYRPVETEAGAWRIYKRRERSTSRLSTP
jgi:hypothetical protein